MLIDILILEDIVFKAEEANTENYNLFRDYSFLVATTYKSLEGILLLISASMNIEQKSASPLAHQFPEDEINKICVDLESRVTSSPIDKNDLDSIKERLSNIKSFIKKYRNEPAHYGTRLESFERAKSFGNGAMECIFQLFLDLDKNGFFDANDKNEEIDVDDIPF